MSEESTALVRNFSAPLAASKGWMKFLGIVFILQGVLTALSIIGILIAWIPIWIGVLLMQSAGAIERAASQGDETAFRESQEKLRTYFIVQGVLMLIGIVFAIIMFLVWGAAIVAMFASGNFQP